MQTHKKPPVNGGANGEAGQGRIINRAAVSGIIRECLGDMGAAQYSAVVPFIEELIHTKIETKAQKLEAFVKKLVTEEIFQKAVLLHTAHVVEQKKTKAAETEQHELDLV